MEDTKTEWMLNVLLVLWLVVCAVFARGLIQLVLVELKKGYL